MPNRMLWCLLGATADGQGGGLEWELFLGEMRALRLLLSLNYSLRACGQSEGLLEMDGRGLLARVRQQWLRKLSYSCSAFLKRISFWKDCAIFRWLYLSWVISRCINWFSFQSSCICNSFPCTLIPFQEFLCPSYPVSHLQFFAQHWIPQSCRDTILLVSSLTNFCSAFLALSSFLSALSQEAFILSLRLSISFFLSSTLCSISFMYPLNSCIFSVFSCTSRKFSALRASNFLLSCMSQSQSTLQKSSSWSSLMQS